MSGFLIKLSARETFVFVVV